MGILTTQRIWGLLALGAVTVNEWNLQCSLQPPEVPGSCNPAAFDLPESPLAAPSVMALNWEVYDLYLNPMWPLFSESKNKQDREAWSTRPRGPGIV